jgi:hypothetical protein
VEPTQMSNQLRSVLRDYFPAGIEAFNLKNKGLACREARTILAAAPTPTAAAGLTVDDLATLLRQAGRTHNIPAWVRRLHEVFGREQMRQLPKVEQALGRAAAALIRQLDAACRAADDLADAINEAFTQHPDYNVLISFPGLGDLTGPRVLAEIGDDRTRFRDARALKVLRRCRAHHPRLGQVPPGHTPQDQEPATRSNRLQLGVCRPRLCRRTCPLRPTQNRRRPPQRRPPQPVQPHARPTPPLSAHRPDLPRRPSLPRPQRQPLDQDLNPKRPLLKTAGLRPAPRPAS